MTKLQLSITRLIGKKDLSFGCIIQLKSKYNYRVIIEREEFFLCTDHQFNKNETTVAIFKYILEPKKIIGHPATLSDLHKWLNGTPFVWKQEYGFIDIENDPFEGFQGMNIAYDSSKELLDQSKETLKAIISLIRSYERN